MNLIQVISGQFMTRQVMSI